MLACTSFPFVHSPIFFFLLKANLFIFSSGFKFSQLEMSSSFHFILIAILPEPCFFSETVLAVMLRSFRFSLSDKEIYWNIAGVNYPTVGKTNEKPAAFLRLERINA